MFWSAAAAPVIRRAKSAVAAGYAAAQPFAAADTRVCHLGFVGVPMTALQPAWMKATTANSWAVVLQDFVRPHSDALLRAVLKKSSLEAIAEARLRTAVSFSTDVNADGAAEAAAAQLPSVACLAPGAGG